MTGFRVRWGAVAVWMCLGVLSSFGCAAQAQRVGVSPAADASRFADRHTATNTALSTQLTAAWSLKAAHGRPTQPMLGS